MKLSCLFLLSNVMLLTQTLCLKGCNIARKATLSKNLFKHDRFIISPVVKMPSNIRCVKNLANLFYIA